MARPLRELNELRKKYDDCPILYAGDIFNRWDARPEVINFALQHLPPGYAVPGQHDLPNHNYDEIHRSAYWTLVETGRLINLPPDELFVIGGGLALWGYPHGWSPKLIKPRTGDRLLHIALAHEFIWTDDTGYTGAPPHKHINVRTKKLGGYDVAVYGDNHKGFAKDCGDGPYIFNCGGFMRRKVDERGYDPRVGLLNADGSVTKHFLDTSKECFTTWTQAEEAVGELLDMKEFVAGLQDLEASDALNFIVAIKRFLQENKVAKRVTEIILQACEGD
jgi:DNA repair exonuclease SbcCD nuclease subunit